ELQDDKDVDWLFKQMIKECGDEGVGTWEMIKMGKGSLLKNKNKDSKEQNPPPPPTPTQKEPNSPDSPLLPLPNKPLQPLSPIVEAKPIESMAIKFKELLEEKPIFHVLENYTYYRKMLDEVSMDKKRLEMKEEIKEEEVAKIIEEGLPKKMDDPGNYIVPLKVNVTTPINALADIGASVSVMPYKLYKVFGLGKSCPSNDKLLMADNTVARAYGKLRNGIMTIDDGVVNHIKKRNKVVAEEDPKDDEDWLDVFEVWHDEKGYPKYGPTLPPFFNIEDEMEPALAMEAYFNSFKNIIVYKKLVDFLGSLPIQLKNIEWTSEGYSTYRKIEGDEVWHAKFEITSPSGRKFTRGFKTKETKRKLSGKFNSDDILKFEHFFD
ncbi:zinc finger, CCHC-type containing protein, partial [Tanacetum coccineum]